MDDFLPAKVVYAMLDGYISRAYLDSTDGTLYTGTNKYTDEPVSVIWDDFQDSWQEV